MSILASFTVCCDLCETDTGDSQPTEEEAMDYAVRGGWSVYEGEETWDQIICDNCLDDLETPR